MGVRREEQHLVVLLEDDPYRSILNGIKNSFNINERVIDDKKPSRGWAKVFDDLENNIHLLKRYPKCHILLLMDFDDKDKTSLSSFEKRTRRLNEITPPEYSERVFILGVNHKESEALKKYFKISKFEHIGKKLIKDCPTGDLLDWQNTHLECNLPEIERMRENGVFDWLFTT
ncbi:MAG: hypothetical protein M0P91_04830 [Sulfuricurvum sp.]|jgi:hypothetical protein|uniref:hypothetical protein n=1 Tax=Sulfuricurvum sp. TaxID=2025608 RepID=UPI0025E73577|nr:hypothetical protein [Sulfuricurvum sp.]MCK9372499.1 hypothetical protein [Sulfuricurvum sp.]